MRIARSLITGWLVCCSFAVQADESTPLLYSRTNIIIARQQAAPPPAQEPSLPWQSSPATQAPPKLLFDVEVRDGTTLYNREGWFELAGMTDNNGVMFAFAAPTMATIPPTTQYAPLDILLLDDQGQIVQIAPNIVLSSLDKEIDTGSPVLAFLFLKGGTCEKLGINPGDEVEYKIFKKPPTVLTTPKAAAPVVAPAAAPAAPVILKPLPAAKPEKKPVKKRP